MSRPTRWEGLGRSTATEYAAHFAALAESGADVHGEASFLASLVEAPARIIDAGCGTGRVAIRLAELGYACLGVDADRAMLAQAVQARVPGVVWALGDVSDVQSWRPASEPTTGSLSLAAVTTLQEWVRTGADLIVLAGNVVPLLAPDSLPATMRTVAGLLIPTGLVVAGFGLDTRHLPAGCPVTPLAEFDAAARAAGLSIVDRFATWSGQEFDGSSADSSPVGYAVTVLTKR